MLDPELHNPTCVIDGLNECDAATAKWLALEIAGCPTNSTVSNTILPRFLIISRHVDGLEPLPRIDLDGRDNREQQSSIDQFIDVRLKQLNRIQGFDDGIRFRVRRDLQNRCEGSFLRLGCVIQELQDQKTCTHVLRCLAESPRGLGPLYNRLLNQITERDRAECSRIVQWVAQAAWPLTLRELAEATNIQVSEGLSSEQALLDMVTSCGDLLRVEDLRRSSWENPQTTVALVHLSLKEHLRGTDLMTSFPGISWSFQDDEKAHLALATRCVEHLQETLRWHGPPFPVDVPLVDYAIKNWP